MTKDRRYHVTPLFPRGSYNSLVLFLLSLLSLGLFSPIASANLDDWVGKARIHYSFNADEYNASHIYDVAGYDNNCTRVGSLAIDGTGVIGSAGYGANNGDSCRTGYKSFMNGAFCVSVWANIITENDAGRILDKSSQYFLSVATANHQFVGFDDANQRLSSVDSWTTAEYNHLLWCLNDTAHVLYINGVKNFTFAGNAFSTESNNLYFFDRSSGDRGIRGELDEITFFDAETDPGFLTDAEAMYLFLNESSGCGYNDSWFCGAGAPVPTGVINTTFRNTSGVDKRFFDESENFFIYANYSKSDTGASINSTNGYCNFTLLDGIIENETEDVYTSLCGTVQCDQAAYTQEYSFYYNIDPGVDMVRAYVCNNASASGDVTINVSCPGAQYLKVFPGANIISCIDGYSTLVAVTDVCVGTDTVNVSVQSDVLFSQRKTLSHLELDRDFQYLHVDYADGRTYFNLSLNLWATTSTYEYYVHGVKTILTNCSSTLSGYDASATDTLTIVNIPPVITFGSCVNDKGIFPLNGTLCEFSRGNWSFTGSVNDDDLSFFNVSFYNSTARFATVTFNSTNVTEYNLSYEHFLRFSGNPYEIKVYAVDTYNNVTYANVSFNVSDSEVPSCSGLYSRVVQNDTNATISGTCTDENFFSLNITCDSGDSLGVEGLNVASYPFSYSVEVLEDIICTYRYCDGHTALSLERIYAEEVEDTPTVKIVSYNALNELTAITSADDVKLTMVREEDRISYTYDFRGDRYIPPLEPVSKTYVFMYRSSPSSYYLDSDIYQGWIVDAKSRVWMDTNNDDPSSDTKVIRVNDTHWRVEVTTIKDVVAFHSIGELNCVEGNFTLTSTLEKEDALEVNTCPDSISNSLMLMLLLFGAFFLMIVGFIFFPFFGILGGVAMLPFSWVYVNCQGTAGYVFGLVGIVAIFYFSFAEY